MSQSNFIVIFGPSAVGKMTVGYELAELTGLKLLHNHMTIDLVTRFFEWGSPKFQLNSEFRTRIFEEVASSDLPGLIFTYVWELDDARDKTFIDESCEVFRKQGANICFVELYADLNERLRRNETEFRLSQKLPKRNVERSRALLLKDEKRYRTNSNGDFFYTENYVKIDNTSLSAGTVAKQIVSEFGLLQIPLTSS